MQGTPRPAARRSGEQPACLARSDVRARPAERVGAVERVLRLIQAAPEGEASVSDLTAPLGLSQPTVSHHLRILTEAGLLEREKRGVWAYYRLVPSAIAAIADLLTPPCKRATKKIR
ncbi:ArsR/SmtB family transcription factor [Plantactinospora solaniradicis]|uniref:ArsR/SmtB family transcription factor n=1 Tax=Plantactinospora solaniradicis TaxID=1723736 RepID=A0ABW1KM75_9ACTN